MNLRLLSVEIGTEPDVVLARQRARLLAELLSFDLQDQTRLATAVSELARNVFQYAKGGRVTFSADRGVGGMFRISIVDRGPGIERLDEILEGRYRSKTGMGIGLAGARKLMDEFAVETSKEGTAITLGKRRSASAAPVTPELIAGIGNRLAARATENPFEEVRQQNQELLRALDALKQREAELVELNRELAETNTGIVALYAELEERAETLREAQALKNRFHSQMNHEVRTPINAIVSLSEVLENGAVAPPHPEQLRPLSLIRKSARQLSELVDDFLDLAKLEAGHMAVRKDTFAVEDVFGALRGIFRPLHTNEAVELVFDRTDHLPELVTDEGKLSQILRNYVSNAIKFTEQGRIIVAGAIEGDRVTFTVSDTGVGITPEDRVFLFRDFVQIESAQQKRSKGTGLGLALCRELAALLGGTVGVSSGAPSGSVFHLTIPRVLPFDSTHPPPSQRTKLT